MLCTIYVFCVSLSTRMSHTNAVHNVLKYLYNMCALCCYIVHTAQQGDFDVITVFRNILDLGSLARSVSASRLSVRAVAGFFIINIIIIILCVQN